MNLKGKGGDIGMDKSESVYKKAIKSSMLKCSGKTYFFDVFVASNSKKYLKVTESRLVKQGEPSKRSSFVLFSDDISNFQTQLNEFVGHLNG